RYRHCHQHRIYRYNQFQSSRAIKTIGQAESGFSGPRIQYSSFRDRRQRRMGSPYVGEIRMFAGNFAPAGWAFCNGATLAIAENDVLFQLIGTTYGGDGQNTFNLPDLQSRVPVHMGTGGGSSYIIGQSAGVEQVTLTTSQIPAHSHPPLCNSGDGTQNSPSNG